MNNRVYYEQHKPRLRNHLEQIFGRGDTEWVDEWAAAKFKAEEMEDGSGFYSLVTMAAIAEQEWIVRQGKKTYFIEDDLSRFLGATKYENVLGDIVPRFVGEFNVEQKSDNGEVFSLCQSGRPPVMAHLHKTGITAHWYGQGKYSAKNNGVLDVMAIDIDYNESLEDNWKWWKKHDVNPTPEIIALVKGLIGFLVYRKAFPEQIFDGFPLCMKAKCERHARADGVSPATVRLTEKLRAVPSAHWRNGCFKTLKADRFKRNSDGSFKIIYVNGCVVGKIDPFHANMEIST